MSPFVGKNAGKVKSMAYPTISGEKGNFFFFFSFFGSDCPLNRNLFLSILLHYIKTIKTQTFKETVNSTNYSAHPIKHVSLGSKQQSIDKNKNDNCNYINFKNPEINLLHIVHMSGKKRFGSNNSVGKSRGPNAQSH